MLADLFTALLAWIHENPHWAYLAVFLVAAGESLVVIGLFLPGVVLMFGFGALVAAGALELGWTLLWAAAGAVCGDGISFLIGRHFHERLRVVWPFSRYQTLLDRGIDFFHHHGGKSVLLARFIGPVRPILPAVAGMLDMPPRRFLTANVLSALLWAPAYTLPGVAFGASLGLAAEVAGRLAVLIVMVVGLVWFGVWAVRAVMRLLEPRAGALLASVLDWGRAHPRLRPLTSAVLDPAYPEARGLAVLLLLVALASVLLAWLAGGWLAGLDLFVHAGLQELRTPVADRALALVTGLGDSRVLLAVLGAGCAWLVLRRRRHAALHWLAAGVSALLLVRLLELAHAVVLRPMDFFEGGGVRGVASAHAALGIAVYGFLAVLVARELTPSRRWIPYTCAALLVIPVAFSRVYLGAHWVSDVLAGAGVGFACVALLGIAYRRHPARAVGWPALALVVSVGLAASGGWWARAHHDRELERHDGPQAVETLAAELWWSGEWRELAAQRQDFRIRHRQELNLQYAGELDALAAALAQEGWHEPRGLSAASALLWLSPRAEAAELPVLPQVHNGHHDALQRVRTGADGQTVYLLRVWPTRWRLQPDAAPVWIGSVTELQLRRRWRLFSFVATGSASSEALATLRGDLAAACEVGPRRRDGVEGDLLLVGRCGR